MADSRRDRVHFLQWGIHLIVGRGMEGFLTRFASGYAIAVVPAVTGNAWGGSLVQTLMNAVDSFGGSAVRVSILIT